MASALPSHTLRRNASTAAERARHQLSSKCLKAVARARSSGVCAASAEEKAAGTTPRRNASLATAAAVTVLCFCTSSSKAACREPCKGRADAQPSVARARFRSADGGRHWIRIRHLHKTSQSKLRGRAMPHTALQCPCRLGKRRQTYTPAAQTLSRPCSTPASQHHLLQTFAPLHSPLGQSRVVESPLLGGQEQVWPTCHLPPRVSKHPRPSKDRGRPPANHPILSRSVPASGCRPPGARLA
mmetsp:Transcript_168063/g.534626  ORF Transcript_168063/g.534626 Transcript_168063/m.534626 type:complete len:242 (+) Transcript_168063:1532-2257(+)